MNEWLVTKEICVLEGEKDIELIFPTRLLCPQWAGSQGNNKCKGQHDFSRPELGVCKRHVKTHNTYLKPLPQNYHLHLWLLSALLPRDTMSNLHLPLQFPALHHVKIISKYVCFTCRSWNQKSCMAVLGTCLRRDKGEVRSVLAVLCALCPSSRPSSFLSDRKRTPSTFLVLNWRVKAGVQVVSTALRGSSMTGAGYSG